MFRHVLIVLVIRRLAERDVRGLAHCSVNVHPHDIRFHLVPSARAIDGHPAGGDPGVRLAAGTDSALADVLVEPHGAAIVPRAAGNVVAPVWCVWYRARTITVHVR
jgi:hypothetical protein